MYTYLRKTNYHTYIYYEKQIVFPWKFADISQAMFTTFLSGHAGI